MTTQYIPAWKDKDGNRLVFLAENHAFDSYERAQEFQIADFIFYIPYGVTPNGIIEMDLADGKGEIPHVMCAGPMGSAVAVIAGPTFQEASTDHVERAG